ncbi:MAG: altronate dehydratase [Chloroflexi bacterium]|nr:altronate dehydratase [Chloroflexota bacterium]
MIILQLHPDDNVALAIRELPAGHVIHTADRSLSILQTIPAGHKLAVRAIGRGELALKYGQPIGRATSDISAGEHAHVHNIESLRGRGDLKTDPSGFGNPKGLGRRSSGDPSNLQPPTSNFPWPEPGRRQSPIRHWSGYRRKDGRVGVRNHVLVLSTVQCANAVVDRIGRALPQVIALSHAWGCSQIGDDLAQTRRVLEEFAAHPNVAAALLIGLGCETMPTVEMGEQLAAAGVLTRRLTIQELGGSRRTCEAGLSVAKELLQEVSAARREPIPLSELIVGLECGGSDAWSGVTANPAVGVASDLIVAAGGTVILSETPEFIGAEHLFAPAPDGRAGRAIDPEVGRQIVAAVQRREADAYRMGVDLRGAQPTPGNIAGGLTTIEEKSLGAIEKGGASPVMQFLPYAHRPTRRGLVVMDTPGNDAESVTGMVAGGAQVVVFTTGRGSPLGCPIAPVIKVASNSAMFRSMAGDLDLDAGAVIEQGESLADVGRRIFDQIIAAANGQQTAAETWGSNEFAINVIGPRM